MVEMTTGPGYGFERRTDLRLAFKLSNYPALAILMGDPKYSKNVLLAAAEIGASYLLATDDERSQMMSSLSERMRKELEDTAERVALKTSLVEEDRRTPKATRRTGAASAGTLRAEPAHSTGQKAPQPTESVPIYQRPPATEQAGTQVIPRGIPEPLPSKIGAPPSEPAGGAASPAASRILDMYSTTFTASGTASKTD